MKFRATAEHCGGKSVGHPCRMGVWDDPTESFDIEIEAATEEDAETMALFAMEKRVTDWGACQCHKHRTLGNDAWWNSVVVHVVPVD